MTPEDEPLAGQLHASFDKNHCLWSLVAHLWEASSVQLANRITIRFDSDPRFAHREYDFPAGAELYRLPDMAGRRGQFRCVSRFRLRSADRRVLLRFNISRDKIWYMGDGER